MPNLINNLRIHDMADCHLLALSSTVEPVGADLDDVLATIGVYITEKRNLRQEITQIDQVLKDLIKLMNKFANPSYDDLYGDDDELF